MKTFPDSIPAPPHRRRPVWGICFCGDETSPTSSLRSMPPLLAGEALAFRDVFQQTQIGFIENDTSLPRAPTLGELARQRLRGQAQQNETRKRSDTMSLTNRVCIAVRFAFCQHPCPLRRIRASSPKGRASGEEALCISPIHTGIYYTDTTKWVGGNGICLW